MLVSIRSTIPSAIAASVFFTQGLAYVLLPRDLILARQISQPIQQCDSICNNFTAALNGCDGAPASCVCTTSTAESLQNCVDCTVSLASAAIQAVVISAQQQISNDYMHGCPGFTINVPGSGGSATGTPTGASSIPGAEQTTVIENTTAGATIPVPSTSSTRASPTPLSTHPTQNLSASKSHHNSGAIAGGIVGGIVAIIAIILLLVFLRRRRGEIKLQEPPFSNQGDGRG